MSDTLLTGSKLKLFRKRRELTSHTQKTPGLGPSVSLRKQMHSYVLPTELFAQRRPQSNALEGRWRLGRTKQVPAPFRLIVVAVA
jgi:hypothetical protein